jgi:hypothetical protein
MPSYMKRVGESAWISRAQPRPFYIYLIILYLLMGFLRFTILHPSDATKDFVVFLGLVGLFTVIGLSRIAKIHFDFAKRVYRIVQGWFFHTSEHEGRFEAMKGLWVLRNRFWLAGGRYWVEIKLGDREEGLLLGRFHRRTRAETFAQEMADLFGLPIVEGKEIVAVLRRWGAGSA